MGNKSLTGKQWRDFVDGNKSLHEIDQENTAGAKSPSKSRRKAKSAKELDDSAGGYQASGDVFERKILDECEILERRELWTGFKVPNPLKIERHIPNTNKVHARIESSRWVDFAGQLAPNGRGVHFEAKAIDPDGEKGDRMLFSKITGTQREKLERVARTGGLAFVYVGRVRHKTLLERYIVPVDAEGKLAGMSRPGSFIFEDWPKYRLERQQNWLEKLVELELFTQ